ncbi:hypothetical protein [Alkalihalobacterium sp. APHAB7]|uniref:hypothetical protein n=1 Tax=Alkalihalobacterium sp. APHAB7 TaxID=3402081 RepID=UPI003AAB6EB0
MSNSKFREFMNVFEEFLGKVHPVELEHYNAEPDRYVREIVQSFHKNLCSDKELFKSVVKHYQFNAQFSYDPDLPKVFSSSEYKSNVNLKNVEKAFVRHCEEVRQAEAEKERRNKRKKKERLQKYAEHEKRKQEGLNYFDKLFLKDLEAFEKLETLKDIKKEYNRQLKILTGHIKAAFLTNDYASEQEKKDKLFQGNRELEKKILHKHQWVNDFQIRQQVYLAVRYKVIERLKAINKFTPLKEIILNVVPVQKGYHHYASNINKDFVDEWDIYFTDKPDVSRAVNNKANRFLYGLEEFNRKDYMFLFSSLNLTSFGFDHLYQVVDHFEKLMEKGENKKKQTLLEKYSNKYDPNRSNFASLYKSHDLNNDNLVFWKFHKMKPFENEVKELIRLAENLTREELKVPKVNEGWVSETRLYQEIKKHFKDRKVIQHARLSFLGKQHLDIFIPSLKVAIEYQGLQHDQPVDFFGGEEGFQKTKERDERKRKLCEENGVKIIYVREGYDLKDIIYEICNC